MQDTFISPVTGRIPKNFVPEEMGFIDQNKTNFLNKILRGEISAVASYEQVIPTFKNYAERFRLEGMRNDHDLIIVKLKMLIEQSRIVPDETSGVWGAAIATLVGAANLMGRTVSLKALQEGEEHGLKLYYEALDLNLTKEEYEVISTQIISTLNRHITSLESMIKDQNDEYDDDLRH